VREGKQKFYDPTATGTVQIATRTATETLYRNDRGAYFVHCDDSRMCYTHGLAGSWRVDQGVWALLESAVSEWVEGLSDDELNIEADPELARLRD